MTTLKRANKTIGLQDHRGWLPPGAATPEPTPAYDLLLEIADDGDGSYYLFSQRSDGEFRTDTWHQSLEEALAQALAQFGVQADEWSEVE